MIIYQITNKITSKIYIGQTRKKLETRWKEHQNDSLRKDTNFARALRKYDIKDWELKIIEFVNKASLLNEREIYWIKYHDSFNNGYNSTTGGNQPITISEETRKKHSENSKGSKNGMYGVISPNKGKKISDSHRLINSLSQKGEKNTFYGKVVCVNYNGDIIITDKETFKNSEELVAKSSNEGKRRIKNKIESYPSLGLSPSI